MKKIFAKVCIMLALAGTSVGITSCGSDEILGALEQALSIWAQLNQGQQLYFNGSSTIKHCTSADGGNSFTYQPTTGVTTNSSHGLNMEVKSGQAYIMLGNFSVEGFSFENIDFPAVTYDNGNIGDVKEEGYVYNVAYTVTKNGQSSTKQTTTDANGNPDYPIAFVDGTVSNDGKLNLNIQIHTSQVEYFEVTYNGYAVTNE